MKLLPMVVTLLVIACVGFAETARTSAGARMRTRLWKLQDADGGNVDGQNAEDTGSDKVSIHFETLTLVKHDSDVSALSVRVVLQHGSDDQEVVKDLKPGDSTELGAESQLPVVAKLYEKGAEDDTLVGEVSFSDSNVNMEGDRVILKRDGIEYALVYTVTKAAVEQPGPGERGEDNGANAVKDGSDRVSGDADDAQTQHAGAPTGHIAFSGGGSRSMILTKMFLDELQPAPTIALHGLSGGAWGVKAYLIGKDLSRGWWKGKSIGKLITSSFPQCKKLAELYCLDRDFEPFVFDKRTCDRKWAALGFWENTMKVAKVPHIEYDAHKFAASLTETWSAPDVGSNIPLSPSSLPDFIENALDAMIKKIRSAVNSVATAVTSIAKKMVTHSMSLVLGILKDFANFVIRNTNDMVDTLNEFNSGVYEGLKGLGMAKSAYYCSSSLYSPEGASAWWKYWRSMMEIFKGENKRKNPAWIHYKITSSKYSGDDLTGFCQKRIGGGAVECIVPGGGRWKGSADKHADLDFLAISSSAPASDLSVSMGLPINVNPFGYADNTLPFEMEVFNHNLLFDKVMDLGEDFNIPAVVRDPEDVSRKVSLDFGANGGEGVSQVYRSFRRRLMTGSSEGVSMQKFCVNVGTCEGDPDVILLTYKSGVQEMVLRPIVPVLGSEYYDLFPTSIIGYEEPVVRLIGDVTKSWIRDVAVEVRKFLAGSDAIECAKAIVHKAKVEIKKAKVTVKNFKGHGSGQSDSDYRVTTPNPMLSDNDAEAPRKKQRKK